jgi:hypothetical protein
MAIVHLSDLPAAFRAQQRSKRRHDLRHYLIGHGDPSAPAYQTVPRRLYADGLIDNLGLTDAWFFAATEAERATLSSQIATALLKV